MVGHREPGHIAGPLGPGPLGGLLALLGAVYEDDVRAVFVSGGLASYRSVLTHFAVLRNNDYAFVMSIFIACVAVFLAIVTAFGPEARGAPFGSRAASGS